MTTTPPKDLWLIEWLEHHDNIRPATVLAMCDRAVLPRRAQCGARAEYIVDFGKDSVGEHPRCRKHTVQVVHSWRGLEAARERTSG